MSSILARLVSDLDIAVLERNPQGSFTLLSEAPSWLSPLLPPGRTPNDPVYPEDLFLFLEDFLERHEAFWSGPTDEQITSGVWTEVMPGGKEHLLQAIALFIDEHPLLLIRVPPEQAHRPIYQHAREQRLENEHLIEEINKREVLLHCIVHDLSNPLSGIKGALDVMQSEELVDPDATELVDLGLRQAKKMQGLIRSILSTFANEVKPLVPTLLGEEVAPDLGECAREVAHSLSATALLKDISIKVLAEESQKPLKVVGETERLERVLFNLLANAIRHTPKGRQITITVKDEETHVAAYVQDEGQGVPDHMIDQLFERFSQGSENTGQAGLGLYFCRITVEHWGGTIGYKQADEGGACFWFRLPRPLKDAAVIVS